MHYKSSSQIYYWCKWKVLVMYRWKQPVSVLNENLQSFFIITINICLTFNRNQQQKLWRMYDVVFSGYFTVTMNWSQHTSRLFYYVWRRTDLCWGPPPIKNDKNRYWEKLPIVLWCNLHDFRFLKQYLYCFKDIFG